MAKELIVFRKGIYRMTEKELSQYYYLKKEIEDLENKLAELGYGVGAIKWSLEPKGTALSASIQEKITELKDLWISRRMDAIETYLKIGNYINTIPEPDIRLIATYRYLNLLTWDQTAAKLGDGSDRTTVAKKMRKYLKNSHFSHLSMK